MTSTTIDVCQHDDRDREWTIAVRLIAATPSTGWDDPGDPGEEEILSAECDGEILLQRDTDLGAYLEDIGMSIDEIFLEAREAANEY